MPDDDFIVEGYRAAVGCPNYKQRTTTPVIFEKVDDRRFYAPI